MDYQLRGKLAFVTAGAHGIGEAIRYSRNGFSSPPANFRADDMSIVAPQKPAPGKLWVFHPSFLDGDSAVDLALLAKGYYIVAPPISGPGAVQKDWDEAISGWSTTDLRRRW